MAPTTRASDPPLTPDAALELVARLRNIEAVIGGFCQLAQEGVIAPDEALSRVEEALGMLARARGAAECALGRSRASASLAACGASALTAGANGKAAASERVPHLSAASA